MGNAREIHRSSSSAGGGGAGQMSPTSQPPALPPRPSAVAASASADNMSSGTSNAALEHTTETGSRSTCNPCSKKYVLLCAACGGLAVVLGSLFAVLYVVLRSYTSSLHYFETVPSYVASVSLILTGLLMLCFGWRRNRFGYLVKLCGFCCLVCAVVCVVITVTTTVVHMNRLQTLRECVYNARGRSCTCFTGSSGTAAGQQQQQPSSISINSPVLDSPHDQGSAKYIFADTPDCEVVHGALYACLRALFGLSVIGILVSLFSGMLVYQLLGHERKKMYWEQLELRSRALFRRHHPPPCCGCCQDCRFAAAPGTNSAMLAWPPWDVLDDRRYWSLHGGNLYSPGPCAGVPPGSGTPCGGGHQGGPLNCPAHHHHHHHHQRRSGGGAGNGTPGWNWLPWRPAVSDSNSDMSARARRTEHDPSGPVIIGPDDHYGFPLSGNNSANYRPPLALTSAGGSPVAANGAAVVAAAVGWGPPPPYSSRGGSTSELGSISASTPMGLSPIRSPPDFLAKVHHGTPTSGSSPSGSSVVRKELLGSGSMRKDQAQVVNLPPRRKSGAHHPSPVGRMVAGQDPRRMPWSPQTGISHAHSNSFPATTRNISMIHQTGSPTTGRENNGVTGKPLGESELYFGDTSSSYTISVHNDGSNSSAMYEEIHGHRYDKIQRPLTKVTSIRSGGKPCQRSSWDGQNQPTRTNAAGTVHPVTTSSSAAIGTAGQPRSRHSADTVGKDKMFSPIVAAKFASNNGPMQSNWGTGQQQQQQQQSIQQATETASETCSFVPYRRAAVVPATSAKPGSGGSFAGEAGEVYENVTNLDFEETNNKSGHPRTLSPDEEVAILTSQFKPSVELEAESGCMEDSDSEGSMEDMRAVNV